MSRQRSAVCPAKIDWEWKGVPVGTQRVASPLDMAVGILRRCYIELNHDVGYCPTTWVGRTSLATCGKEDGWEVWTRGQETKALGDLVGKTSLNTRRMCIAFWYRIEGAARLIGIVALIQARGLLNEKED